MTIQVSGWVCRRAGSGSLARIGQAASPALFVDWLIAYGLAALAMTFGVGHRCRRLSTAVLVIWFVLGAVSVRLFGFTPGQFALGLMRGARRQPACTSGLGRALVRGLLIALVIPALFTDTDGARTAGPADRTPRSCGAELSACAHASRCTPRIFARARQRALRHRRGPGLASPARASRDSSESICLTVMLAGSLVRWRSSLASGTSPSPLPTTMS